jgi:AcrR family transcriptional regulator
MPRQQISIVSEQPARVRSRRAPAAVSERRARGAHSQRQRMLTAAVKVLAEYGYTPAFSGLVTGRAGISRRTFQELFGGSEGCFLAAFDDAVEQMSAEIEPAYRGGDSWRARIRAGLAALLAFLDHEPELCSLVIRDALTVGPQVLERRVQILQQLTAVVDEGRKEGEVHEELTPLTAEGVVGAVFSVTHTQLLEPDGGPLVELLNPLSTMILLPYLGHTTAKQELRRRPPRTHPTPPGTKTLAPAAAAPQLTHRSRLILQTIHAEPGLANGQIAERVGLRDLGHTSRLLLNLRDQGLIANNTLGRTTGERNAWTTTPQGTEIVDESRN